MIRRPKVVITGMGVLAANGIGVPAFWDSLLAGRSGIGPITLFDASHHFLRIAGEVKGFNLTDYVNGQFKSKRLARHTQFAVVATRMALDDAGLDKEALLKSGPVPINLGVSTSAIDLIEGGMDRLVNHGPEKVSPFVVTYGLPHAITYTITDYLGINAEGRTISSACQSGAEGIAMAWDSIVSGKAEVCIAGGADAPITPLTVAAFCSGGLRPDAYDENAPEKSSRPFDLNRKGGVLAEGAAVLVLESLEHAIARGAKIYAELVGFGNAMDAAGEKPGAGLRVSMASALANAGYMPENIQYINAHGPSEPEMDVVETVAIRRIFGRHADRIPVSSIKAVTGNPLAAQGPMQMIATAMGLKHGIIPPTANLEYPDPQCDLDYVPLTSRRVKIKNALVNVHGLGGGNISAVMGAIEPS